jgi:hypothetical protein
MNFGSGNKQAAFGFHPQAQALGFELELGNTGGNNATRRGGLR